MNKILYTGGTFDLFHYGHISFLKHCKRISDHVVVSLNTDNFVERFKGHKPILNYRERERSLRYCKYVDEVILNGSGEDSRSCILTVKPTIIAVGDDWAGKDYYKQMGFDQCWLDDNQITLVYVPYARGISSTEIKERIINQKRLKEEK